MSKNLWLTFKSQIQEKYSSFSKTEQRLADYMLQNPDIVMTSTAAQIAEAVGVSPASVIRFSKASGFSGLAELKMSLKREHYAFNTEKLAGDIHENDSIPLVKQKMMGYHIKIVESVLSNWNESAYTNAVEEILSARKILVISCGGSKAAAICLVDFLLQLNLPCEMWDDTSFNAMKIGSMSAGDIVLAVNFTGRYLDTIQNLQFAKEMGITTIGITASLDSPMIQYTDIVLNSGLIEKEYQWSTLSARISELVVVEVLYSLLAARMGYSAEDCRTENRVLELLRVPQKQHGAE